LYYFLSRYFPEPWNVEVLQRSRVLWEVLPVMDEALGELSQIYKYFRDLAAIRNCLHVASAHFFPRLKRNAFDIILTAFAFSPFNCSEIRATSQGLETQGEIVSIGEATFVSEMRQEFQRVFDVQETSHTEDSDLHQFLLPSGVHDIDDTELRDPIDPKSISDCPLPPDPDRDLVKQFFKMNSRFPEFSAWGEI
jgi:hypothetical protein